MSTDIRGHTSIAAGETPSRAAIANMLLSVKDPISVANTTARATLISTLSGGGITASTSNPIFVFRADAAVGRELEYTTDGTNFTAVLAGSTAPATFAAYGGSPASGAFGSGFTDLSGSSSVYTNAVAFHKLAGQVFLGGVVSVTANFSAGALVAWLPAGFRPSAVADSNGRRRYVVPYGGTAVGVIEICGDGKILAQTGTGSGDLISLDGITFVALG